MNWMEQELHLHFNSAKNAGLKSFYNGSRNWISRLTGVRVARRSDGPITYSAGGALGKHCVWMEKTGPTKKDIFGSIV